MIVILYIVIACILFGGGMIVGEVYMIHDIRDNFKNAFKDKDAISKKEIFHILNPLDEISE